MKDVVTEQMPEDGGTLEHLCQQLCISGYARNSQLSTSDQSRATYFQY